MLKVNARWYMNKIRKILLACDVLDQNLLVKAYAKNIICPVSKMKIREAKYAGAMLTIDGKKYYFCTYACRTKFVKDPEKYLNNKVRV